MTTRDTITLGTMDSFKTRCRMGEMMAPHTTFRIGGPAKIFFEPENVEDLAEALAHFNRQGERTFILGAGSNLLVHDEGVDGAVISLRRGAGFRRVHMEGMRIIAGAGVMLPKVVKMASVAGLSGLEALVGIPGTVGGAARMNAGGRHGTIGPLLDSVMVMNRNGVVERWPREKLSFGNRISNLRDVIVLEMEILLKADRPETVAERTREIFEEKKNAQPLWEPSAGCVFKNPPGVSAGLLIDRAGLKGLRVGGAVVSEKHANFIVNRGGATASDVLKLIDLVREKVLKTHGVTLELEVEIW